MSTRLTKMLRRMMVPGAPTSGLNGPTHREMIPAHERRKADELHRQQVQNSRLPW